MVRDAIIRQSVRNATWPLACSHGLHSSTPSIRREFSTFESPDNGESTETTNEDTAPRLLRSRPRALIIPQFDPLAESLSCGTVNGS